MVVARQAQSLLICVEASARPGYREEVTIMATVSELEAAIQGLWLRPDIVWHAARLRSDAEDERGEWPQRIDIHIKFYRALLRAECVNGIPVEIVSHGRSGRATPQHVRSRTFIEWDARADSASQDGIWRAFMIFALIPEEGGFRLWCWICESVEEEDYAEAVFGWWEPQSFACAVGPPLFPQRFTSLY